MENGKKCLVNEKVEIKILLAGLWLVMMLLYVYCDIFSLYRTGQIEKIISGKMGFLDINQVNLVIASILMIIPTLMIGLCLILPAKINRILNIIIGILYVLVNIGNIVSETWIYYFLFGIIEIVVILGLIFKAIKWPVED